jgi:phenol hydroxylase P5 protein
MVIDLLERGFEQELLVLHGVRRARDRYHVELFEELARAHDNLTYTSVLSEAEPEDQGPSGYVHEHLATYYDGRFNGRQAYLCGPPPMIEANIRTLMKGRLFERDIFTERFVTADDGKAALARSPLFKKI